MGDKSNPKKGLSESLEKYGVDMSKPNEKQITFRIAEKVVLE